MLVTVIETLGAIFIGGCLSLAGYCALRTMIYWCRLIMDLIRAIIE